LIGYLEIEKMAKYWNTMQQLNGQLQFKLAILLYHA